MSFWLGLTPWLRDWRAAAAAVVRSRLGLTWVYSGCAGSAAKVFWAIYLDAIVLCPEVGRTPAGPT